MGQPTPFVNSFLEPNIGSLRYNTSQAGSPLPIVYGTQRVTINILELWGFKGSSSKSGVFGSKGGLSGKSGGKKTGTFSVYTAFAVCQGPAFFTGSTWGGPGGNRIWANAGIHYGLSGVGLNGFIGTDGQSADPVFVSQDPNRPVLNYSGTCYLTGSPLQLGSSPAMPNISFEMTGFGVGTAGSQQPNDANPSFIVTDLISNPRYGAGFPSANIDTASLNDFANYCQSSGIVLSKLMDRLEPAIRTIEEVCHLTVAAPFWSGALLRIVPYLTASYARFFSSWSPNLTAQYSLNDDDFIDWGGDSDPVIVTRSDPTQIPNWISIEYLDVSNSYNTNISYAFDQGAIDQYGLRNGSPLEGHSITNTFSAHMSAQSVLQYGQLVRTKFKFQLGWTKCLLEPMDIVQLTDSGAGLNQFPVRITSITENDNGELTFEAEEIPSISTPLPVLNTQAATSAVPDIYASPGDANPPVVFEPNSSLSGNTNEVWILSSGGSNWGGANVFVSTDGTTYTYIGALYAGAPQGTAVAVAAGGANPDTTNTLQVNLTESNGTLSTVGSATAAAAGTLCYLGGELLSYQTATLISAGVYNLTTLYRGLYGTPNESHTSGTPFAYLGLVSRPLGVIKYDYPASLIGTVIHIKLQSFNSYLQATQDLSALTPYTYTLTGQGTVSPVNLPFSFSGIPQSGHPVVNYTFGEGDSFPTNFVGSVCTSGVAATVSTTFNIAKNGTNFATMVFGASSSTATFSGSPQSFVSGDVLTITPARTDATLANLTGNLAGMS